MIFYFKGDEKSRRDDKGFRHVLPAAITRLLWEISETRLNILNLIEGEGGERGGSRTCIRVFGSNQKLYHD